MRRVGPAASELCSLVKSIAIIKSGRDFMPEETMSDTAKVYALSAVIIRIGYYLLAASVLVFVAMLLLAGVHPW
jgi:uncharacterized membrane protein YbaN (DUF454 family)